MRTRRTAFTLVELLVVVVILLVIATMVYAIFGTGRSSEKMRSGARIVQSALLGAKDRALHAKDLRGVRLTRDLGDPTLVNGFVYLQPLPLQTYPTGSIQLERLDYVDNMTGNPPPDGLADTNGIFIVRGFDAQSNNPPPPSINTPSVDFAFKQQFFPANPRIRIPSGTGQWYSFFVNMQGKYALAQGNEVLQLQTPFVQQPGASANQWPAIVAWPTASGFSSCDIQLGNDLLPFHQPFSLPSGVVIDLRYFRNDPVLSSSRNNSIIVQQIQSGNPNIDIMFTPRGIVSGPVAALGPIHFLLRDIQDVALDVGLANPFTAISAIKVGPPIGPNPDPNKGDRLIVTIFPQTGLVQTFEIDPTDNVTNGTNPPVKVSDGLADNIFNFAQQGKSAGR